MDKIGNINFAACNEDEQTRKLKEEKRGYIYNFTEIVSTTFYALSTDPRNTARPIFERPRA